MKTTLWIATVVCFLISWWWYVCPHKQVCPFGSYSSQGPAMTMENPEISPKPDETHVEAERAGTMNDPAPSQGGDLTFDWSSPVPQIASGFTEIRDSILGHLENDDRLEITGLYFLNEENETRFPNLGYARANHVKLLFPGLSSDRFQLNAEQLDSNVERSHSFAGVRFRRIIHNESVWEWGEKMVINFPYASDEMLDNARVNDYLDQLVVAVQDSNQKIRIVGHTDNTASTRRNSYLGRLRAEAIKKILIRKGLPEERILTESMGESAPIASNETAQGRRQNRRVEISLLDE